MHEILADRMLTGAATVLAVADIKASLAYYRDSLGFSIEFRWGDPVAYACLCREDVSIHLASTAITKRRPGEGAICIFARDIDVLHAELAARGAHILKPPETYPYGMREFNAHDPDGNQIIFGMPVAN